MASINVILEYLSILHEMDILMDKIDFFQRGSFLALGLVGVDIELHKTHQFLHDQSMILYSMSKRLLSKQELGKEDCK